MKILGAACLAIGVVALSAVVASGAAVGAVVEGFHSAKKTMQNILKKEDALASDEVQTGNTDIAGAAKDEA